MEIKAYFDGCCELAWQAGIVDGEGCLTLARQIRRNRPSPAFRVSITIANTNKKLIEPFFNMWGGGIYHTRETRNFWADAYTWHCPDKKAKEFLLAIFPFLRGKKEQAKLLILFIDNKKMFKRHSLGQGFGSAPLGKEEITFREYIWKNIKRLNTKGVFSRQGFMKEVVSYATKTN